MNWDPVIIWALAITCIMTAASIPALLAWDRRRLEYNAEIAAAEQELDRRWDEHVTHPAPDGGYWNPPAPAAPPPQMREQNKNPSPFGPVQAGRVPGHAPGRHLRPVTAADLAPVIMPGEAPPAPPRFTDTGGMRAVTDDVIAWMRADQARWAADFAARAEQDRKELAL